MTLQPRGYDIGDFFFLFFLASTQFYIIIYDVYNRSTVEFFLSDFSDYNALLE